MRSKIKEKEFHDQMVANALAILNFCLQNGVSVKESKVFAGLSVDFQTFEALFEWSEGDLDLLKKVLLKRIIETEKNRITSCLTKD